MCVCVCVCVCVTYSWQTKEARCSQVLVSDAGPRLHHRHHGGELTDCSLNHLLSNRYRGAYGSIGNLAISIGFQHSNPGWNLLDKNRNPVPSLRERSEARLWLALSGIVIPLALLNVLRTLVFALRNIHPCRWWKRWAVPFIYFLGINALAVSCTQSPQDEREATVITSGVWCSKLSSIVKRCSLQKELRTCHPLLFPWCLAWEVCADITIWGTPTLAMWQVAGRL